MESMLTVFAVVIGLLIMLAVGIGLGLLIRRRSTRSTARTELRSELLDLRAIGELSVFRVVTKDILTHTDHGFGEFGRRYLKWAFSQKKLAMVFEFEMDFRFDLRDPALKLETGVITPQGGRFAHLTLPACRCTVLLRDLSFYDEQRARLLPWLLPDLLNGFLPTGFSEADKNQLIASARQHAQNQAGMMLERYRRDIESSATQTLVPILKSLGAREVTVNFQPAPASVALIDSESAPSPTANTDPAAASQRAA